MDTDEWLSAYVDALTKEGWTPHEINTMGTNWYDIEDPPWKRFTVFEAVEIAKVWKSKTKHLN